MPRKALTFISILFFIIFIPTVFFVLTYAEKPSLTEEKVVYNLPYPGLLPDHPLYFFKRLRNKVLELFTRDNLKKGELYLLFSDKGMAESLLLTKKGKRKLAIHSFVKGEEYFSKIPSLLEKSKKQGVAPQSELIQKLKLSNAKHKEVGEQLLKDLTQGDNTLMEKAMKENMIIRREIERI